MTQVNLTEKIATGAKYTSSALILYGSYSRGDFDESSDIDVLEITDRPQSPYSVREINYSPYSLDQLKKMAGEGNLFVLHIITEGKLVKGDKSVLGIVESKFKYPNNYDFLRFEIIQTAGLLDVGEKTYMLHQTGYYGLLCYLFRSYLYSVSVDAGDIRFSVKQLSITYNNSDIMRVFSMKKKKSISFTEYSWCKKVFESFTNEQFENDSIDSVELLKILKHSTPFGFKVAMHFLNDFASEVYI